MTICSSSTPVAPIPVHDLVLSRPGRRPVCGVWISELWSRSRMRRREVLGRASISDHTRSAWHDVGSGRRPIAATRLRDSGGLSTPAAIPARCATKMSAEVRRVRRVVHPQRKSGAGRRAVAAVVAASATGRRSNQRRTRRWGAVVPLFGPLGRSWGRQPRATRGGRRAWGRRIGRDVNRWLHQGKHEGARRISRRLGDDLVARA